jgi:hypothetical protein
MTLKTASVALVFISLLSCAFSPSALAGACDPASEAGNTRRIDGPANVRAQPNDQSAILASLPNHSTVVIESFVEKQQRGKSQIWYYVSWTQAGKTYEGWTHEQNIICD